MVHTSCPAHSARHIVEVGTGRSERRRGALCFDDVGVYEESLRSSGGVASHVQVPRSRLERHVRHLEVPRLVRCTRPLERLVLCVVAQVVHLTRSCPEVIALAEVPPRRSTQRVLRDARVPEVRRDAHDRVNGMFILSAVCGAPSWYFVRRLADAVPAHRVAPSSVDERAANE